MANLIKWAGKSFSLTIANKAKDNTGISYVTGSAWSNSFQGLSTTKVTSVTNNAAGNTAPSVVTFNTVGPTSMVPKSNAGIAILESYFSVKWTNGDATHNISTENIELRYPADQLRSDIVSGSYVYSDSTNKYTVWAYNGWGATADSHGDTNGAYAQNTASLTVTGAEGYSSTGAVINAVSNQAFTLAFNNTCNISVANEVILNSTSFAGDDASNPSYAAPTTLTRTDKIYVMNATKEIKVNGSTSASNFYVVEGQTLSMEFDVIPTNPGTAYSYAVTLAQTPATAASHTLTAAAAGKKGTVAIKGLKIGTTKLQLKSTATAKGQILSPVVTIYVSSNVTEIFINCGDKYSWALASADVTFTVSGDCITAVKSGSTLVITAKALANNVDEAVAVITLNTGAKLTVNVAHLELTLA